MLANLAPLEIFYALARMLATGTGILFGVAFISLLLSAGARKSQEAAGKRVIIAKECLKIPCRGWAEMIRKVYEVNPLRCPPFSSIFSLLDLLLPSCYKP